MTFIQYLILFSLVYLYVYALIGRICKCIEHCATARAYSKLRENGVMTKMSDVEAGIIKIGKEKEDARKNLTKAQLDVMVREKIGDELIRVKQEATDDAVNTAMVLLLTLPLEVLMDHYWTKSYAKRIPKFTERVLEYYERWQNGELDMEKLKEDLWEYGGVKLVESEGEAT